MAHPQRQPFFPAGKYVVRKQFTMQGVDYNPGDNFPWEELGLSEHKALTMFNAHFIMLAPNPVKIEKAGKKPKPGDDDDDNGEDDNEEVSSDKKKEAKAARAKARAEARKKKAKK